MLDRAWRFVVFPAAFAAFALLFVGGLFSCMEGKRVADPNCVFIAVTVTDDPAAPQTEGTVALVYNFDVSSQIYPYFDVVVYGPLTNVYNIAFRLQYDPAILQYLGASDGLVFDDAVCSGSCTKLQVDNTTEADKLLVGLTRKVPPCGDCADCADCADVVDGGPAVDCTNSIDDDGDGSIDEFDCTNDIDDDGDGSIDEANCSNDIDDDGDGSIDEADCSNVIDDDGDGLIDETACNDCITSDCINDIDDDGNGRIDELDGAICNDCITSDCSNVIDDDGDGSIDETSGIDFAAGANVVMTLKFTPTAGGGPSAFDFVEGTLELKDAGGPGDPPFPSPKELSTGWFAGSITTRQECL